MKIKTIHFLFILISLWTSVAHAQLKVWPQNNVSIGPVWWSSFPSSENMFINGSIEVNAYPASSSISIKNYSNTTNDPAIIPSYGNSAWLGNPSYQFYRVYGYELYSNFVQVTSDEKLKTNKKKIQGDSALILIRKINSYSYDFKPEAFKNTKEDRKQQMLSSSKNQIGFMAQELNQILPQLVKQDDSLGTYSINYIGIIPLLVEAIKEQQARIDSLEARINKH